MVRLVQPNAAQELKWLPGMERTFYERHLALSRAPGRPDVTIWSETAVPFVLGHAPELQAEAAGAAGPEGRLILGIRRVEPAAEGERWYNALAVLDPGRRGARDLRQAPPGAVRGIHPARPAAQAAAAAGARHR